MKHLLNNLKFMAWLSAEDMHDTSKEWLSELQLAKDELNFFENLLRDFKHKLTLKNGVDHVQEMEHTIRRLQKRNMELIKGLTEHGNELEVMVDGIDQIKKESDYKEEHKDLLLLITDYLKDFKALKFEIFEVVKGFRKEDKLQHQLDNK